MSDRRWVVSDAPRDSVNYLRLDGVWTDIASTAPTITGVWKFQNLRIIDTGGTDYVDLSHNGTNLSIAATNTTAIHVSGAEWNFLGGNTVRVQDGGLFAIYDATDSDYAYFQHDGTDFITGFQNTTDWNIIGITAIQAGTVDADFDAITATSYGGITEANLLDKTASETVSGAYTFTTAPIFDFNTTVWFGDGSSTLPNPRFRSAVGYGGWARGWNYLAADGVTVHGGVGALGNSDTLTQFAMGFGTTWYSANNDGIIVAQNAGTMYGSWTVTTNLTATGGTTSLSTLNAGNIDSTGTITASSYLTTDAGNGKGLGFWAGAPTTYGIYLSAAGDATYGGRVTGETTSDYNMYFEMNGGTNRGFVFETDGTKLFGVNPDAVRSSVNVYADSILPNADNTYDLGTAALQWNQLFVTQVEIGGVTDTTITREAAGHIAVAGQTVAQHGTGQTNANYSSHDVFFSTSAASGGTSGDIWYQYTA